MLNFYHFQTLNPPIIHDINRNPAVPPNLKRQRNRATISFYHITIYPRYRQEYLA